MLGRTNEIATCEICGNRNLTPVLDLGLHPMCDDLVCIGDNRVCREYPIDILFCQICHTAHQRFQVAKEELFPRTYHYRSRFTADVLNGMNDIVASCESRFGPLAEKLVLDVGCNDGSLLGFFRDKSARTIGIEPTNAYLDAKEEGHTTYNEFLSEKVADEIVDSHGKPDIIVFTNVFAHIENLAQVLNSLRRLVAPQTVIVIENHYLGSVLNGNQFDTFYHEHPRTYSYSSFAHIARSLGVTLAGVEFPSRYGGIRVFLSRAGADGMDLTQKETILRHEALYLSRFGKIRENVETWRVNKNAYVTEQVAKHGKLRAKAFPGRAAILVKLLGLDHQMIEAVHEKPGSMKIGHYVPGTHIPIVSDDELFSTGDQSKPLLNLAWHIPAEIRAYLTQHGYAGPVVDIVVAEDFAPLR